MRFCTNNILELARVTAESEFSATEFPVSKILDRRTTKRWRSYRAPNLMLYGNCDNANAPTLDGTPLAATDGTWTRDEDMKYEGTGSWKHVKTSVSGGGSTNVWMQDSTASDDMHGLTAGETYEIRCRIRGGGLLSAVESCGLLFYVYRGGAWEYIATLRPTTLNSWDLATAIFTIPADTTGIRFRLYIITSENPGATVWIDSIKFYVSNDEISYGNCESATYDPTLDGGTSALTNGTWARDTGTFYQWSASWQLKKTTAPGAGVASIILGDNSLTTDMHGLVAGATYQFKVATRTSATPAQVGIRIWEYYSAAWTAIIFGQPTTANVWELDTKTITINPLTTGVRIQLYIGTNEATNSTFNIDVLSVRREARITIDLYAADNPQYAAIAGHNLSSSAVVKVEANTTPSWTTPAVSETMTYDAFLMLKFLTNITAYRYWSFVFDDYDYNEDGYVEIGYAPLGDWLTCQTGPKVDRSRRYDDKSVATELDSGAVIGMLGAKLEGTEYETPPWTRENSEAFDAMYEEVRTFKPFVFLLTEDNFVAVKPLYARFERPIERIHDQNTNRYSYKFTLKEAK